MTNYVEIQQNAFLDELQKIAMSKEAGLGDLIAKVRGPVNPFKAGPGVFQRYGQDLMAGGKMLASKQLVAPGQFAQAGVGRRVAGEVAQSAGHHYAHKSTLGNALNPLGGAIGGVAEGLTRSAGKELHGAGQSVGGRTGGALRAAGTGLQRAAKPAGMAGEVAGLASLGSALHVPLSAAGLLGGKVMGAAAHAAPAVGDALHHAGHTVGHAVHDVVGNAGQSLAGKARNVVGFAPKAVPKPVTGYSVMPPPMGAHA